MEYKRNKDLMEVFNARWKANNNDDVKRMKERDSIRQKKILSSNPSEYLKESDFDSLNDLKDVKSSREIQLERLSKNMDQLRQNRSNFNG